MACALIGRIWPQVMPWPVVAVMLWYVYARRAECIAGLRNFKNLDSRQRALALIPLLYLLVAVGIVISGQIGYFPILLLLCVDLLI